MSTANDKHEGWDVVIRPKKGWWELDLGELWHYRDLVRLMVRRDVVAQYKQTVLGPLWHVVQPITTTLMFTIMFGLVARLPTSGIPPILFYMSGIVPWSFFATTITKTSQTFISQAQLMTKVYFPRLAVPISTAISSMVGFAIQFVLLILFMACYAAFAHFHWTPSPMLAYFPLLLVLMTVLSLSVGIIISAMTIKFRDLNFLVGFGVQLLMYASPVIFSPTLLNKNPKLRAVVDLNPMTGVIEAMRAMLFGGGVQVHALLYSIVFALVMLLFGLVLFQRMERSFADVI